jgi:two-component system chemotaxis response regulator CheY
MFTDKKVMVIDDSKTVRSYHKALLKDMGLEVFEAENGMEALEKSLENSVDLFLVDINMPIMDGYSFVKEIRTQDAHHTTPIIMISTQSHDDDKIEAYEMGANLYEIKPIKPDDLNRILKIIFA